MRAHLGGLSTAVAALAATAALGGPADASGQEVEPWPIKEFQVVAVEPSGLSETGRNLDDYVEELVRIIRSAGYFDPDFPTIFQTVALDSATQAEMESVLRTAAAKLESWGFSPPALEPVVANEVGADAYRVYLVTGRDFSGEYHPRSCAHGLREAVIVLEAERILDSSGSVRDWGVQTLVHELVHATQYATPAYRCGDGSPGDWITEGTARAIGADLARQIRGLRSFGSLWEPFWGARLYSERLPVETSIGRAYRTSSFWRFLAEYNRARPTFPGPGASWPSSYSYLPRLLERDLNPRDCSAAGDPCDAELRWIDAGLRDQLGLSLRELYARFIQAYALYGEGRVHSTEGGSASAWRKKWLWRSFAHEDGQGCPEISLGTDPEQRQRKIVVPRFADVSAMCWEVELEGFDEGVTLAVTASYRPGTEALVEQLTAVMADASGRVDPAEVRTVAGAPEASWYYDHLTPGDPALFLLTNVADSPDATRGLVNLSLTFTALDPYAVITSSPGPTGDEVDQPIGVRFDYVPTGALFSASGTKYQHDPGLHEPCVLRVLGFSNARGDQLSIFMDHDGPIGPGQYTVAPFVRHYGAKHPRPWEERPPGMAVISFTLGADNPMSGGRAQSFHGMGGTLRVESVGGGFVQGALDVSGVNHDAEDVVRGFPPPPSYVPNATIRVEFGLLVFDPRDPARDSGAIRCLSSDSRGRSGRGGGGGSGDSTASSDVPPDDPEPPEGPRPGSESQRAGQGADRPSEAAAASLGPGGTRWVSVRAEGRPELSFHGSDVGGSAGATFRCWGTAGPADLTVYAGESARTTDVGLTVIVPGGIAEGATGTYPIDQVVFLAGGGVLDWRGPVALELSRHDASTDPAARRVAGRILGLSVVERATGVAIPIEVEFDINSACAPYSGR